MGQHHVGCWPMRQLYAGPTKETSSSWSIGWDPQDNEVNACGPRR